MRKLFLGVSMREEKSSWELKFLEHLSKDIWNIKTVLPKENYPVFWLFFQFYLWSFCQRWDKCGKQRKPSAITEIFHEPVSWYRVLQAQAPLVGVTLDPFPGCSDWDAFVWDPQWLHLEPRSNLILVGPNTQSVFSITVCLESASPQMKAGAYIIYSCFTEPSPAACKVPGRSW